MKKNKIEVVPRLRSNSSTATPSKSPPTGGAKSAPSRHAEHPPRHRQRPRRAPLPQVRQQARRQQRPGHRASRSVPKSLLVIGAGAIGLELGSVWAPPRCRSHHHRIPPPRRRHRLRPRNLPKILQRSLEKLGIKFELSTKIESATVSDKGVELQGRPRTSKPVTYSGDHRPRLRRPQALHHRPRSRQGRRQAHRTRPHRRQRPLADQRPQHLFHRRRHRRPHARPQGPRGRHRRRRAHRRQARPR